MRKKLFYFVTTTTLVVSLSACGSKAPRPSSELALAGSALESAESSGAKQHAPIQLRLAREKKAAADKAIAEKQYDKARYLTVEARVDAELAKAAAAAEKAQQELKRAQDNIEPLRGDVQPAGNSQ